MKKNYTLKGLNAFSSVSKKVVLFGTFLILIGSSVFSQFNYYLRTDSLNPTTGVQVKPNPNNVRSWTSDPAGTVNGTRPKNFTAADQVFHIQSNGFSNTGFTMNNAWRVLGSGSKVVIGAIDSLINFSFGVNSVFVGTIDVLKGATLAIGQANTDSLTLNTLAVGSTVRYSGHALFYQKVIAANYYNLNLTSGNNVLPFLYPQATIGVAGTLTHPTQKIIGFKGCSFDFNGTGGQAIPGGYYYNLTVSGTKTIMDTLRGTTGTPINIAGSFQNLATGLPVTLLPYYALASGALSAANVNYVGLVPQSINNLTFANLGFITGQQFSVSSFDNTAKTITLAYPNSELIVGSKVSSSPLNNVVVLDTTTVITAITSDTILTLSNAPIMRLFNWKVGHALNVRDTLYASAFSTANKTITLSSANVPAVGDTLISQIFASVKVGNITTPNTVVAVNGNVITVSNPLTNVNNLNAVFFGSSDRKASDKTITGFIPILGTFNAGTGVVNAVNSSIFYAGKRQAVPGFVYGNLTISQDSATAAALSGPATVKGVFTLDKGKLITTNARPLTLDVNASFPDVTNDTFFVAGPLAKVFDGASSFKFQIGAVLAGVSYPRSLTVNTNGSGTKTFTTSFVYAKPLNSSFVDTKSISRIDSASYYNVALSNYSAGADTSVKIKFQYRYDSLITTSTLLLAHYKGGKFVSEGSTLEPASGPTTTFGYITTDTAIRTFGRFAFGFGIFNLPVKFGKVSAVSLTKNSNKVSWTSLTEVNVSKYVIEASANGKTFIAKGSVNAYGASQYSYTDLEPSVGVTYYRIKAIDRNGEITYSAIVSVKSNGIATELLSVYPNPVQNKSLSVVLNTASGNYTLSLTSVLGQTIMSKVINHNGESANYTVELPTSVKAGTYFLKMENGKVNQQT